MSAHYRSLTCNGAKHRVLVAFRIPNGMMLFRRLPPLVCAESLFSSLRDAAIVETPLDSIYRLADNRATPALRRGGSTIRNLQRVTLIPTRRPRACCRDQTVAYRSANCYNIRATRLFIYAHKSGCCFSRFPARGTHRVAKYRRRPTQPAPRATPRHFSPCPGVA